ncbi:lipopolysaccharide biosynthesis protein [Microbacterium sp. RURRCA19A]|uniref:lipopolysaccharide biosynthesis protein n=1 Tax=Microbacterium sp. RURRCA19A TaxID=1907391 RepID=UPI000954E371|nr:lipopolysaccharide biosynthesis protein [Microbacterium sp. RURRCA19A]SIR78597.1 polysaccharide transporter, PST family [Microbacterium sp. RURRCA19A]
MGLADSAARGAFVTIAGQVLKFLTQLATLVVLARLLTPSDFGVVAMVTAITGVALVIGDFGLSMAAIQAKNITPGQKSNLFWLNAGIGLAAGAIVFFAAGAIAAFYNQPVLDALTKFLALTFVINGLNTQFKSELTRALKFKQLAMVDVSAQAAGLVVAVVLALLGFGYWALGWQQVTIAALTLLVSAVLARWLPGLPRRRQHMRELLHFGVNTMGVQLVTYVSNNVDSLTLGRVAGPAVVGLYSRAFQMFALPVQQLAAPMTRVALPVLSRIDDDAQYRRYVGAAQRVLSYLLVGSFIFLAAVASPLFSILFGPQWGGSVILFQILAIGGIFQALGYIYYWIFLSKALTWLQLRYSVIGRAALIALVIGGSVGGAVGVAWGYSIGLAIIWALYSIFAIRKTGLTARLLIEIAAWPIGVHLVCGAAAWAIGWAGADLPTITVLVLQTAVYLGMFAISFAVPRVRRDLAEIFSIAQRLRRRK